MKYQLEIFVGDGSSVIVDLDAGENVLSADSSHRYVLRETSGNLGSEDASTVVKVIRRGDDLVVEGLPEQQSLQITEYFSRCSGEECSVKFASNEGGSSASITPADALWTQASAEGVALTLSSNLEPFLAEAANSTEQKSGSTGSTPTASIDSTSASEVTANGSSGGSFRAENRSASATTPGSSSEPNDGDDGGLSWGGILGGALGVGAVAGLAGGGGGDEGSGPESAPQPSVTSVDIEGSDQQVSADEVSSDGAWRVTGTASDATSVQIAIRVSSTGGTQADIVSTDQFAVDANGNWSAAYSTGFFSGSQPGQITLTITPFASDASTGPATTRTYSYSGLTTAGPGNPTDTVVLSSEDILDSEGSLLIDETTNLQPNSSQQSSYTEAAYPTSVLLDETRLTEL